MEYIEQDKQGMTNAKYLAEKTSTEADKLLSERNLRQEERMMDLLLNRGPQANTSTGASTAGTVRDISEVSGSNEQGPSTKK